MTLHEDKIFEKINYTLEGLTNSEFENCTFKQCDFTNCDLSGNRFCDCTFINCNLALVKLTGTGLRSVAFKECKVLGLNFSHCDTFLFAVHFENSIVDYSSFMGRKMLKTNFIQSSLKEVNFSNCQLQGSVFHQTDLRGALFHQSILKQADFRTAFNFIIDPALNDVKKAKFSLHGLAGLLASYDIVIES
ncbi:MAG TPA: pentapeptide repeat-containing protein [Bacteroidia bacterium]|nr:pentapeptide repeat-containing protein [Bacteroidia bacterium]